MVDGLRSDDAERATVGLWGRSEGRREVMQRRVVVVSLQREFGGEEQFLNSEVPSGDKALTRVREMVGGVTRLTVDFEYEVCTIRCFTYFY